MRTTILINIIIALVLFTHNVDGVDFFDQDTLPLNVEDSIIVNETGELEELSSDYRRTEYDSNGIPISAQQNRRLSASNSFITGEPIRTDNGKIPKTTCPKGSYRPSNRVTGNREDGCVPCPKGFYGIVSGLTTSTCSGACPMGRYNDREGRTSLQDCLPCPTGRYGSSTGLDSALCTADCPPGKYTRGGISYKSECIDCPPNYRGFQCTWAVEPRSGQVQDHFAGGPFGYSITKDPLKQA